VRDALARLWVGSSIGQGYLGDDDNGGHSSWHIFSALGFYPLQVGSPYYVIGSPLYSKATVALENGKSIVITANNNSPANVYVQSLKVNGEPYTKTYLPHSLLVEGATLEFEMGPEASPWGTGVDDAPLSLTSGAVAAKPLTDAAKGGIPTAGDSTNVAALFDDNSSTGVTFPAANPTVNYRFVSGSPTVTFYTLTSGDATGDPTGWTLSGSTDGVDYVVLDTRASQKFSHRAMTRAFKVATPGAYSYYRLQFTAPVAARIVEVELLAR
jgi:hypothetical protein